MKTGVLGGTSGNPPLHLGTYINRDIPIAIEFLPCGREVLIRSRVTVRRRWQRQRRTERPGDVRQVKTGKHSTFFKMTTSEIG